MLLSILGMYNDDETIFDNMDIPDGLDKEMVIQNILLECAELEILYTRPDILKKAIEVWAYSNRYQWQTLYDTMFFDYNPLWNVDATVNDTENTTRTDNRDITTNSTGQDKETRNLTDIESVKGFNSNSWAEHTRNVGTGTDTHDYKSNSKTDDDLSSNGSRTYQQRRTGNIGVTSSQDLIKQEREIANFNLIMIITQSFKERFCLLVY